MGSRALVMAKGINCLTVPNHTHNTTSFFGSISKRAVILRRNCSASAATRSALDPPDVPRLAQTARISLAPHEVEEFAPKIRQVVDWFGQLQAVDLQSVEPSIRADTEGDNLRDDVPRTFNNREAMISGVPKYEEPYIRVPKVLNKE